jgi:hypothetical protein
MNITRFIAASIAPLIILAITGCTRDVPYRDIGFKDDFDAAKCKQLYAKYDAAKPEGPYPELADPDDRCWRRSREEHDVYDLLTVEFDDQGWVQDAWEIDVAKPSKDFIDQLLAQLEGIYQDQNGKRGLSLVVYVHGWHHNARATDKDVHAFRRMLRQIAQMEDNLSREGYQPMRVVGVFVGWRGEALPIWGLRGITFWDRKNTAQRVANGSVRELLGRLDDFRDSKIAPGPRKAARNVRMLTIGHSFGGLIAFESLSSDFVRNSVRFKQGVFEHGVSRVGDLVVIVNPAFEGIKYEPLRVSSVRMQGLSEKQLPALIIATSEGDWATKYAFRYARQLSTSLEIERGEQRAANVNTVGHNKRFTTHYLKSGICSGDDCRKACGTYRADPKQDLPGAVDNFKIRAEYALMRRIADEGVARKEHMCNELVLEATDRWVPERNPFWVVQTSEDVIFDHGDIFNPNFVAFLRQMYLGFIFAVYGSPPPR